jgi:UDP-2,3-diacylglucosamine pyrophosphatase LpxH
VTAATRRFRSLFISDVHLGMRGCQAGRLLDFLKHHDAQTIYLVGDIVDGWALRSSWYWPQAHNDVVQKLLRKARAGAARGRTAGAIWWCTATSSISW